MKLPPPPAIRSREDALFLDFDGTLVRFAEVPDAVIVDAHLRRVLAGLHGVLDGALALVSGRRIDSLDRLLAPLRLPAVGLHGVELRAHADGSTLTTAGSVSMPGDTLAQCHAFAASHAGVVIEEKAIAVALHYRTAPQHGNAVVAFADTLRAALGADWQLQPGHAVIELKPAGADKGTGIAHLLDDAPFAGRRPLFCGDDRTDEHGFAAVNERGGVSVKVGAGATAAGYRVRDVTAVHAWLDAALNLEAIS